MSIEEQCKKYGVPTPDTCKQLAFDGQTLHTWIDCSIIGGMRVLNQNQIDMLMRDGFKFEEIASAPQLHELLATMKIQTISLFVFLNTATNEAFFTAENVARIKILNS